MCAEEQPGIATTISLQRVTSPRRRFDLTQSRKGAGKWRSAECADKGLRGLHGRPSSKPFHLCHLWSDRFHCRLAGASPRLRPFALSEFESMEAHWPAFGLKRPGAPESPDAVTGTRAAPLGGGKLRVQCDPAPRAEHYQIWIQVAPDDADFRLAESPAEPDRILEGLAVGATVKVKMRAVNETGPGPFGDVIQATVG